MVCVTQHTLNCCNTVVFSVEEERESGGGVILIAVIQGKLKRLKNE